MHTILLTIGTDGDVFPFVGLGSALRLRGHRVTLASSEDYRGLATRHGFDFAPLLSIEEMRDLLANPDFWHPIKTARISARWGVRFIERQYKLVRKLAGRDDAVLVSNPAVFAAALVQETLQKPLATLLLQPWMIPSSIAPPAMPMVTFPSWTPRTVLKAFWRFVDEVGDHFIGRELNRLRISLGLKPVRRIFKNWLSPQLVIGMFPEWYGLPQSDWPLQIKLTGFPIFDGSAQTSLAPDLVEFCSARPTFAFTFGTGMMHSARLFRAAIESCRILNVQGIFLTKYRDQLPAALPSFARHCDFVPFRELFPRCEAIVHHGGIGTVAQALAAGTPQLILPLAFDQMDNAARVKRLGNGGWLKAKHVTGERIAVELRKLSTSEIRGRCRSVSASFGKNDALQTSATLVENLARTHSALVAK